MRIGPHLIAPNLVLAPMAGVTDRPFRQLCRRLGAGLAVSEMTTSDSRLWHTEKSRLRMDHRGEDAPIAVQIAGYDAAMMADAARHNVAQGAQIIDINMGCPAKKVCRVDAGSALMKDEALVAAICAATVAAVEVPVTLKIRTGYSRGHKNAVAIARIAQDCGIAALTVHGRTREDQYEGEAEYETIAAVKQAVRIPVIANGDITSAGRARAVLTATGADGLMIGRGALGNPCRRPGRPGPARALVRRGRRDAAVPSRGVARLLRPRARRARRSQAHPVVLPGPRRQRSAVGDGEPGRMRRRATRAGGGILRCGRPDPGGLSAGTP
jgi:tRNA-dihydrouridine synthase B